jgi:hypothetical protein
MKEIICKHCGQPVSDEQIGRQFRQGQEFFTSHAECLAKLEKERLEAVARGTRREVVPGWTFEEWMANAG